MLILTKYRTCRFWYTLVYVVFPLKALFSSKASPWTWLYVLIMKCVSNSIFPLLADAAQILYPCMQCADIFFLEGKYLSRYCIPWYSKRNFIEFSLSSEKLSIFPFWLYLLILMKTERLLIFQSGVHLQSRNKNSVYKSFSLSFFFCRLTYASWGWTKGRLC